MVYASSGIRLASSSHTPDRLGPRIRSGFSAVRNRTAAPVVRVTFGYGVSLIPPHRPNSVATARNMGSVVSASMIPVGLPTR